MSDRRLIEEFLPLSVVHEQSARQKGRRRLGNISAIHYWWARRPLPAARTAVYAALAPAPLELSAETLAAKFRALCDWPISEAAVREARSELARASGGRPLRVLDPFAGGGSIPLEASRLGCEATAIELNPVAHLIQLCTLVYPQTFGLTLADDLRRWGSWLIDHARVELADLYPVLNDGEIGQSRLDGTIEQGRRVPIAYLWTRSVPCPNSAVREHSVPLVRQTWLAKKEGSYVALRPLAARSTMTVAWEVVHGPTKAALGFDPEGFSARGATTCLLCGASVDAEYAKAAGQAGKMRSELMAVALMRPGARGKLYCGSAEGDRLLPDDRLLADRLKDLESEGFTPPAGLIAAADTQHFQAPMYGMSSFGDLFTQRQLAMLLTCSRLVRRAHTAMLDEGIPPERARAITTFLGLLVSRMSDYSSSLCHWHSKNSKPESTFARQALPMTWDFAEVNPFGGAAGDFRTNLEEMALAVEHCAAIKNPAVVIRGSATELPLEDASQDAVITDPPYYDNITYADLSDFFYVWLKASVGHLYPEHLAGELTPKRNEAIASPYRHGGDRGAARHAYEETMAQAFAEARRVLRSDGVMVCVYAHQTTAGWATLIEAVRRAGFEVVEAWPLDTEMPARGVAQGTASLASSIFLAARPRADTTTGDWAHDVRPTLQSIVSERVDQLTALGINGTDLVIAVIGAGMRAYTRYARVEKPNGEELSPDEYLEEVEREVSETILSRIFGTDRAGLGRVDQETQFYVMGRFEFRDALAPWDELNTLGRGTGVEVRELTVGDHALVAFGTRRSEARLRDHTERGESIELGRSTIDHLHRVLWLADNAPERVREYLDTTRPDVERLRLVAQALSRPGLDAAAQHGPETEACQRLLVSWKRLIEDNLFTGGAA